MKNTTKKIYDDLFVKYPALNCCAQDILTVFEIIKETYANGGKVLVCGNGGSAADSEHIVGELMKCFSRQRMLQIS